ncbi:MAG: CDP-alcohol phosphatidyltransferase family protein [Deltaproteobacteria bacterium]|nr:CDP-alcohol phosphatidyltransferase family protein [Deltaproteobacteria bacterium]
MNPATGSLAYSHWATGLVLAFACSVIFAYSLRTVFIGRAADPRLAKEGGTAFLGRWLIEAFYWSFRSFGRVLLKAGFTPDALTWISFAMTMACLPAAALGHFSTAGLFFGLGAAFDAFDGMVARERGLASDSGEMLDAIIDRYADMAPLLGLAVFYRFSAWQMAIPLTALVGSVMVSYVRAKTEALDLSLPSGLMRRHERITYFVIALVGGPELSPWLPSPFGAVHPATLATIALVAVISNFAAVRLAAQGRAELVRLGRGPGGKKP